MEPTPKAKKPTVKPKKTKPFVGPKKKLDAKLNKLPQKGKKTTVPLKKTAKKPKGEPEKLAIASLKKPIKEIQSTSKKYQKHKPSDNVLKEAQGAAILPSRRANESVANRSHVEVMDAQTKDTKGFDKNGFKKKLKEQIDDTIKQKEDAKKIKSNGVSETVTKEIGESVGDEKAKAGGKVEASTIVPPAAPETPPNEATNEEPQKLIAVKPEAKTTTAQKTDLAPVSRPKEETDFTKETKVLDDDYQQNNLSQEKLQNSDEPKFIAADNQKQDSEAKAKELTDQTRSGEKKTIHNTRTSNTRTINAGYDTMLQKQSTTNKGRFDQQSKKSQEENKIRNDVHKQLTSIFNHANSLVLMYFASIDVYIEKVFGKRLTNFLDVFSERVAQLLDDNDGLEWLGKKITGQHVQDDVEIFNVAKDEFIDHMQNPIDDLVDFVDVALTKANKAIQDGRKKADEYWSKQSSETKRIAGDIYDDANAKFDELESAVESKEGAIIDTVTEKFSAALDELDERFEKAKIENMSWLDRAIAAVKSVINTIIELKNALQQLAQKAAKYAERIIDDPITFFGNLADGVGQGFTNFKNNIDKHLIKGVLEWLTGSIGNEIELPKELNFEGITSLVLQILGITVKKIKGLVIDVIGKERFEFIEKGVDTTMAAGNKILNIFKILNEKGLSGLWEFILEEFDNLKEMLIENVKTFVIETIAMKAMEYLLSLLIPGAGFIRAAQLIIKFVITLFQKAAQIIKIIDGILDTFGDILNKNLSAVVTKVEMVLSGFLSLAISFLAAVLGLDGIVGKVQKFIQQKIRPRIDQVLKNIALKLKKVLDKIGITKLIDKSMKAVDKGKAWVEDKKKKAVEKGKQIGEKVLSFFGIKKKFKAVDGQQHTLFFEGDDKHPQLMIASDKMTFELFINKITDPAEKKKAQDLSDKINTILNDDVSSISDVSKRESKIKENQNKINAYLDRIANIASKYFKFSVLPVSRIQFESASIGGGVMGKKMLAFPLTANHPEGSESVKDTSNPAYNKIEMRGYKNGSFYVKGHLLNNNLGGPGSWINYTPFPGALFNTSVHYQKYEHPLKKAVDNNEIFYYKVEAIYGRTQPAIDPNDSPTVKEIKQSEITVPESINLEVFKYDFNPDNQSYEKSKTQPSFAGTANEKITIQGDGYYAKGSGGNPPKIFSFKNKTLSELTGAGIDPAVAQKIKDRQKSNLIITDYEGQLGATKEAILNAIKSVDDTYTDISQN